MGYLGGNQVIDKTLAIVGFGQIGQYIGKLAQAFNMKILYVDPEEKDTDINAERVSLEEALIDADYVITQLNYNETYHHLFAKKELVKIIDNAYFINTARKSFEEEDALVEESENKQGQAAAMDVHYDKTKYNEE